MLSHKPLLLAGMCVLLATVLCGALIVLPNYRRAAAIHAQIRELQIKVSGTSTREEVLRELDHRVDESRSHIQRDLKSIPESADIELLVGKLSLPTDGVTVKDQQIAAGQPTDAAQGLDLGAMAMPVTIDMHAQFDAIFALLQAAESMQRLVRVASMHLTRPTEADGSPSDAPPVLAASITLEAIYQPPASDAPALAPAKALASGDGAKKEAAGK